jgi:hypothetical protein
VHQDQNLWIKRDGEEITIQGQKIIYPSDERNGNVSEVKDDEIAESKKKNFGLLKTITIKFKNWFDNEENKILKLLMVILIGIVITMFWYFNATVRELRQSQNGSKTKIHRSGDSSSSYGVESFDGEFCSSFIFLIAINEFLVSAEFVSNSPFSSNRYSTHHHQSRLLDDKLSVR